MLIHLRIKEYLLLGSVKRSFAENGQVVHVSSNGSVPIPEEGSMCSPKRTFCVLIWNYLFLYCRSALVVKYVSLSEIIWFIIEGQLWLLAMCLNLKLYCLIMKGSSDCQIFNVNAFKSIFFLCWWRGHLLKTAKWSTYLQMALY